MPAGNLITDLYQAEWRNTLWGTIDSGVAVTNLSGWLDMPSMRGSNIDRVARHGTYPGQKRLSERIIEVEVAADSTTALDAILAATVVDEDPAEETLCLWFGTAAIQQVAARLERRAVPTDHAWSIGDLRCTLQWTATDPRRYSIVEHTAAAGLPGVSVGGLTFPLTFPLTFGTPGGGGNTVATNSGDATTWPTFTIFGPVDGPAITNLDTGQKLQFAPGFTVPAGQSLLIDTDARSAMLAGVPRGDALVVRQWFGLPPGDTGIGFSAVGTYDLSAHLTASWRDTWI